jgi:hypothetical protein
VPFGMRSAGQNFAPTFMRHMYEYGPRPSRWRRCGWPTASTPRRIRRRSSRSA